MGAWGWRAVVLGVHVGLDRCGSVVFQYLSVLRISARPFRARDHQQPAISVGGDDRCANRGRLYVAVSARPWIAQPVPAEITGAGGKAQSRL